MSDQASPLQPYDLRTEHLHYPLGIDEQAPVLAWKLAGTGPDRRQTGFRVRVVVDADPRDDSVVPAWDTGTVESDRSVDLPYAGQPLRARTRYAWAVRVIDEGGRDSGWSEPAWWETGLMGVLPGPDPAPDTDSSVDPGSDALPQWISAPTEPNATDYANLDVSRHLTNIDRIWAERAADGGAPRDVCFRKVFEIPGHPDVSRARLVADADGDAQVVGSINDQGVASDGSDVSGTLRAGTNRLVVRVELAPEAEPGLVARLEIALADGSTLVVGSDDSWECAVVPAGSGVAAGLDGFGGTDGSGDTDVDLPWTLAESYGPHGAPPIGRSALTYRPSPYLRRRFELSTPVRRARLHATALGLYEASINGQRVGDQHFAPGWTDYHRRLQYQTYDVTDALTVGSNALGAILADGWYAGHVGWMPLFHYGDRRAFWAWLEIEHVDGSRTVVVSDESWTSGEGGIRYADMQNGEVVDARMEPEGWDRAEFDDSTWPPVTVIEPSHGRLEAQVSPPILVRHRMPARSVEKRGSGRYLVDFGQNLVGWVQLRVHGSAGQRVFLRHAEVLDHHGELYLEALRTARATDEYVLRGDPEGEVFEPRFTVHGFRYCEITGYPGELYAEDVTAVVAYAGMEHIGEFACSDSRLTKLQQNIVWGQRGNFLAVPTDCPQRDERLGWTGDAQVFASTSAFNYDVRGFFRKWLRDVRDAQRPDGAVTHVVPDVLTPFEEFGNPSGAAGWGDAVLVVPHALHEAYGDQRSLAEAYDGIVAWLDYLQVNSDAFVRPDELFGDWLALSNTQTPQDLVATAFFAWAASLASQIARALERPEDATRWQELYSNVRRAFRARYVRGGGQVMSGTQTAYVLALHFELLEPDEEPKAARRLVDDLAGRNWHLTTGFLGTPYLLQVLTRFGHADAAFRLLTQDSYPSWLYPVVNGNATTIWERWDSWNDAHGFQDPAMTSFNHYAYGAVGEWMYRTIGGIAPGAPGYRHIVVRPRPGGGISWARASVETPYGKVSTRWRTAGGRFSLNLVVPPGTTAEVWLPGSDRPEHVGSGMHEFVA